MRRPLAMLGIGMEGICAALVAAGALCFKQGLQLVKRLSLIVDEAPWCCAVTVRGLPMEAVQSCCWLVKEKHGSGTLCEIDNYNFPTEFMVKCSKQAVKIFGKLCKDNGANVVVHLSGQVTRLEEEAVQRCCSFAREKHGTWCEIADCRVPGQVTVVCSDLTVETFSELCRKEGASVATDFSLLQPTHTSAMDPLRPRIEAAIDEALPYLKAPQNRLWIAAESRDSSVGQHPQEIRAMLQRCLRKPINLVHTVEQVIREDHPDTLFVAGTSASVRHILGAISRDIPHLARWYRAGGEV